MKLVLALTLLCYTLPGLAGDTTDPVAGEPSSRVTMEKAHPDILHLEWDLTRKLADKKDGRVTPEQYQAWKIEFRAHLDATMALVPPSPDNTAVHARITMQLGEPEQAHASLDQALEQNPESPVLLRTKGQILYEQSDFPGAARNGLQAWEKSGHTDQGAWALYQMSKGRRAPSGTATSSPGPSTLTQGSPAVSANDSSKPFKLSVKGSAQPTAVPNPGHTGTEPTKREGGLPLWPLAVPVAGGLIAYGVYRGTKQTAAQETEQSTASALITASPSLVEPAKVAGGVIRNVAKAAAAKTLGDIAVTGAAAVGILVAGGAVIILTVNHGINEMIAAQDKYNEAIDTHRDDRRRSVKPTRATHINEVPKNTEPVGGSGPKPSPGPVFLPLSVGPQARSRDCSLNISDDVLQRFIDKTRLAQGFLPKHEGPGHTMERHVSKRPEYLRERLRGEGLEDASTFFDQNTAERIIRSAVQTHEAQIAAWFSANIYDQFDARYTGSHENPIGNALSWQNPDMLLPKYDAVVRLRRTSQCRIYILTAYPE